MESPDCAGSTQVLRMRLNGKMISGALDRMHPRLLNKPLVAKTARGDDLPWVGNAAWRVAYAPDFRILGTAGAGSSRLAGDSGYNFIVDVTDLAVRGRENKLLVEHLGEALRLRRYFPKTRPLLDFVFDELAVEFSQQPPIGGTSRQTEEFRADRLMVQPPATVNVCKAVTLQSGGGLKIDLPGLPLQLTWV